VADQSRSPTNPRIRQGDIYLIRNCDPLDGGVAKDRPVIVVRVPTEGSGKPFAVVACSTQGSSSERDKVQLPDTGREPQTKSGLHQRCWAIPRWHFAVDASRLNERIGFIKGAVLRSVVEAYFNRIYHSGPSREERP
jgi:hypothetical protein